MSRATGYVLFSDGIVKYFEYCGTSDYCRSRLFDSYKERCENWNGKDNYRQCNCSSQEDVELANDYGGYAYWKGKACRKCMALTDGLDLCADGVKHSDHDWGDLSEYNK